MPQGPEGVRASHLLGLQALVSRAVWALVGRWETWRASPDVLVGVCSKPGSGGLCTPPLILRLFQELRVLLLDLFAKGEV
jgi:hypothetical protein